MSKDLETMLDELVEKKYQLRLEHNHYDMKWYAYYAQRGQRNLFESDLYSSGEDDWKTAGDTPLDAVQKLYDMMTAPTREPLLEPKSKK